MSSRHPLSLWGDRLCCAADLRLWSHGSLCQPCMYTLIRRHPLSLWGDRLYLCGALHHSHVITLASTSSASHATCWLVLADVWQAWSQTWSQWTLIQTFSIRDLPSFACLSSHVRALANSHVLWSAHSGQLVPMALYV